MAPTLIVLGLLALGVAIVAWATRRRPGQSRIVRHEQDIVWNDPMTPKPGPTTGTTETPDAAAHPFPVGEDKAKEPHP